MVAETDPVDHLKRLFTKGRLRIDILHQVSQAVEKNGNAHQTEKVDSGHCGTFTKPSLFSSRVGRGGFLKKPASLRGFSHSGDFKFLKK